MTSSEYALLIDIACILASGLVILPVIVYLFTDWSARREKLLAYLTEDALTLYYEQFVGISKVTDVKKSFKKRFGLLYGRRRYVLPILFLLLTTALAAWGIARTVQLWQGVSPARYGIPPIAISATAGAFAWVMVDSLGRIRRRDFAPTDVGSAAFRFLLAVPFGFAFSKVVTEPIGIPLAFFLGAFPTGTLFTIARRIGSQKLGLGDQDTTGILELEKLQCIGRSNAEQL